MTCAHKDEDNDDDDDDYGYYKIDDDGDKCTVEKAYRIDKSHPKYNEFYGIFVNSIYSSLLNSYEKSNEQLIELCNKLKNKM